MDTKRILLHFYVVAGTVPKSSAHDATLKTEDSLSHLNILRLNLMQLVAWGQHFVYVKREKLSLQHVSLECVDLNLT